MNISFKILLVFSVMTIFQCGKSDKSKTDVEKSVKKEETKIVVRYVTAKGGLRMRDKSDISGNKMSTIPTGTKVDLLEETGKAMTISGATGKWSKVKWGDKTGWVFGGFLSKEKIKKVVVLPIPKTEMKYQIGRELAGFFFNIDTEIFYRFEMGNRVRVSINNLNSYTDSYYKIVLNEVSGTIFYASIILDRKSLEKKGVDLKLDLSGKISYKHKKIYAIGLNRMIKVENKEIDDFVKGNITLKDLLTMERVDPEVQLEIKVKGFKVSRNNMFLRKEPDIKSKKIIKLKKGQIVFIIEKTASFYMMNKRPGFWYKIKTLKSNYGYVHSGYLSKVR